MRLGILGRLLFVMGSGLLFASCDSDYDVGGDTSPVAVQFSSGSISHTRTTAGGNQWSAGDKVGIFMLAENGNFNTPGDVLEDNRPYKADATGLNSGFTLDEGTPVFYPQNGDKVDFIAYYPYKSPLTSYIYPVDVSVQTAPADIDVLYSNNAKGYNKHSGTVDLQFNHALSKLGFTLISGDGSPALAGTKVEITHLATTADIDLANGVVTATNSGQTLVANTATDGLSGSAIVIPQTLSGTKLVVTLADNVSKFEWDFPADTEFLTGNNHQYTITVSKTGITVNSSGITIWTGTGDPATPGTAQRGYKVGDYYPDPTAIYQNGVLISGTPAVGVVFWLSNQGVGDHPHDKVSEHGKIVGLYTAYGYWNNMDTWVNSYPSTYGGSGWHMPTLEELNYLYCAYNGMKYETWDNNKPNDISKNYGSRAWFRAKITDAGGGNIADSQHWSDKFSPSPLNVTLHFNSGNIVVDNITIRERWTRVMTSF